MQRENLAYEWNDVALLVDQRAYTIICKTMLNIPQQNINEIQDVILSDWTWQSDLGCQETLQEKLVPFQGTVTLQIYYLNQAFQQEHFDVQVPIQGAWQEPLIQQNSMRLVCYHTKQAKEQLLLETVLQINRNQPLERSQVLLGQFQMEELLELESPWPSCDTLWATSVILVPTDWTIHAQQLRLSGEYQMVCIYQNAAQTGEQIFLYEKRQPMEAVLAVPEGLQELSGMMPYYQSITAQVLDETHILIGGSGVFCTLPVEDDVSELVVHMQPDIQERQTQESDELECGDMKLDQPPSVVNSRGSRRANLSKYMRDLNNSVETPSSIRNFEIGAEHDLPD